MLEESIPAAWASLNSWFTPALLFVFLNVMIGTIAIASGLGTQKHPQQQQQQGQENPQLVRSPSVLQRIKSINLYRYRSQDLTPFSSITTTTLPLPDEQEHTQQAVDSFHEQEQQPQFDDDHEQEQQPQFDENLHHLETEESETEEIETETETPYFHVEEHHMTRTTSDSRPASGEMPVKLPKKMKKSASVKSAFSHFEEEEQILKARPATVREGKKAVQSFGDDEEVDAKADDFINKFKQQLKLQRLDSILRYKEMLGRGTTEK